MLVTLLSAALATLCDDPTTPLPRLADPVKIEANGKPISVDTGHAAPCVYDFDHDGKKDLLVGQFGGGTCRIYRNVGTNAAPRFETFALLQAGGSDAKMKPG
jgi:hypothetical protein